ncbi:LLM class flavin-dependent oxidoreductase [Streptomyces sp. NPDC002677]|uniref:LLM class flavin-dependent oxidoreductase n=1 Tax=Streptomyces sp. NPDC002677 TaxID=3154774 RepID=UPI003322408E
MDNNTKLSECPSPAFPSASPQVGHAVTVRLRITTEPGRCAYRPPHPLAPGVDRLGRDLRRERAVAEYQAHGRTLLPPTEGLARLDETVRIPRPIRTRDVSGFEGGYCRLKGTRNEPRPVRRPGPPLLIGGWGTRLLRPAEHADIWNACPDRRTAPAQHDGVRRRARPGAGRAPRRTGPGSGGDRPLGPGPGVVRRTRGHPGDGSRPSSGPG